MLGVVVAALAVAAEIRVSTSPSRVGSTLLDGAVVETQQMYVYVPEEAGIQRVTFYVDEEAAHGEGHIENQPPFDLAGTAENRDAIPYQVGTLSNGPHFVVVVVSFSGLSPVTLRATFSIAAPARPNYFLANSNDDRSGTAPLNGRVVSGNAYFTLEPPTVNIVSVAFYLDRAADGTPDRVERRAPYDYNGGTVARGNPFDTTTLTNEAHWLRASVAFNNGTSVTVEAVFSVGNLVSTAVPTAVPTAAPTAAPTTAPTPVPTTAPTPTAAPVSDQYFLANSNADRSGTAPLNDTVVSGNAYITLEPTTNVATVTFYLDKTGGTPDRVERNGPFDFRGGSASSAQPLDTTALSDGVHTLRAFVNKNDGVVVEVVAVFRVQNGLMGLVVGATIVGFEYVPGGEAPPPQRISISAPDGAVVGYAVETNAAWLLVGNAGVTPASHEVDVDPVGLDSGTYSAPVRVTSPGYAPVLFEVFLDVKEVSTGGSVYQLVVAIREDRTDAMPLAGRRLFNEPVYVYITPETGVAMVEFFLNEVTPTPYRTERSAPFDLKGSSAWNLDDALVGANTIFARVTRTGGEQEMVSASFTVDLTLPAGSGFALNPVLYTRDVLMGASHDFVAVVGLNTAAQGATISFSASAPATWLSVANGQDRTAPGNVVVTMSAGSLEAGRHSAEILVTSPDLNPVVVPVVMTVVDPSVLLLTVDRQTISVTRAVGSTDVLEEVIGVGVAAHNTQETTYTVSTNAAGGWLSLRQQTGMTPDTLVVSIQAAGLPEGMVTATVRLESPGHVAALIEVAMTVIPANKCAPVACSEVRVGLPFEATFAGEAGGLLDGQGVGTGLRHLFSAGPGQGYVPEAIRVDEAQGGQLLLTSRPGSNDLDRNNGVNHVGVGYAGPNHVAVASTTLVRPAAAGTAGAGEEAGLYFGHGVDDFAKLVFEHTSTNAGFRVRFQLEVGGTVVQTAVEAVSLQPTDNLRLVLTMDPHQRFIAAAYAVADGTLRDLARTEEEVPPEFYSFDAAGIDPVIGTRSFVGIFASHHEAAAAVTFGFAVLSVNAVVQTPAPQTGPVELDFTRVSYNLRFATGMVFGPDGRLYVTELFGTVHALTYNNAMEVIDDEVITTLGDDSGPRMTLGITVDPESTATDITLYLSHSSSDVQNGGLNSGTVTRLRGPGFRDLEHIMTGLPRAIANHGPNSLHFGPDGRLYVMIGGNTGAGSVTVARTEFRDRPEQPLSAALLVGDIKKPGFDGHCYKARDGENPLTGAPKCDVTTFVTGLRNSYDFTFHSNGNTYGTDNGLGVTGAFPPRPTPDCSAISDHRPVSEGGNNPGEQNDRLLHLKEGKYYGHPNPSRQECVFHDGTLQRHSPLANYEPPIGDAGKHASANGLIEYTGNKACGTLKGALMFTRYSRGDDVRVATLSPDGKRVEGSIKTLVSGFSDPLTLAQGPNGDIVVAEFGANRVTSIRINTISGC